MMHGMIAPGVCACGFRTENSKGLGGHLGGVGKRGVPPVRVKHRVTCGACGCVVAAMRPVAGSCPVCGRRVWKT